MKKYHVYRHKASLNVVDPQERIVLFWSYGNKMWVRSSYTPRDALFYMQYVGTYRMQLK